MNKNENKTIVDKDAQRDSSRQLLANNELDLDRGPDATIGQSDLSENYAAKCGISLEDNVINLFESLFTLDYRLYFMSPIVY